MVRVSVDILNEIMSILTGDHSDESVEGDNDDSSMTDDVLTQPKGLLDLCSRVVAENYSCADLDGHNLDEALLQKVYLVRMVANLIVGRRLCPPNFSQTRKNVKNPY